MPILSALLAPVALMASALSGPVSEANALGTAPPAEPPMSSRLPDWLTFSEHHEPEAADQVRIESRVILRIVPHPRPSREELMSRFEPTEVRIVERPARKCLAMRDIAGVADRGDRLMLFLRDRRVMVPVLEKACSPRDFYRGFYLERSADGMLCAGRDRLMSRSGASCQLEGIRELVQVAERR